MNVELMTVRLGSDDDPAHFLVAIQRMIDTSTDILLVDLPETNIRTLMPLPLRLVERALGDRLSGAIIWFHVGWRELLARPYADYPPTSLIMLNGTTGQQARDAVGSYRYRHHLLTAAEEWLERAYRHVKVV
jgi:hypothetical protein